MKKAWIAIKNYVIYVTGGPINNVQALVQMVALIINMYKTHKYLVNGKISFFLMCTYWRFWHSLVFVMHEQSGCA